MYGYMQPSLSNKTHTTTTQYPNIHSTVSNMQTSFILKPFGVYCQIWLTYHELYIQNNQIYKHLHKMNPNGHIYVITNVDPYFLKDSQHKKPKQKQIFEIRCFESKQSSLFFKDSIFFGYWNQSKSKIFLQNIIQLQGVFPFTHSIEKQLSIIQHLVSHDFHSSCSLSIDSRKVQFDFTPICLSREQAELHISLNKSYPTYSILSMNHQNIQLTYNEVVLQNTKPHASMYNLKPHSQSKNINQTQQQTQHQQTQQTQQQTQHQQTQQQTQKNLLHKQLQNNNIIIRAYNQNQCAKKDKLKKQYFFTSSTDTFDLYKLHSCKNGTSESESAIESEFVEYAMIPNYKTSKYMNSIFNYIKENENIDYIEDSEDEDFFENPDKNKWIKNNGYVKLPYFFHQKFKKWCPIIC